MFGTNRPRLRSAAADSFIASKSASYIQLKTVMTRILHPSSARAQDDIYFNNIGTCICEPGLATRELEPKCLTRAILSDLFQI